MPLARDRNGNIVPSMRYGAAQKLTTSGASQQLTFGTQTDLIAIHCSQDFYFAVGSNPTASPTTHHLVSATYLTIVVTAGDKIAVIQDSASGTFWMSENGPS